MEQLNCELCEKTRKAYSIKQIKNHQSCIKADWKIWNKFRKNETGLGWDYMNNTASDESW